MLSQRACVHSQDASHEMFIFTTIVENTTLSCILKALECSCEMSGFQSMEQYMRFANLISYCLTADNASSNEKLFKKIIHRFKDQLDVIILLSWCVAHQVGLALQAHLGMLDTIHPIYCLSRLLRHHVHRMNFAAHFLGVIPGKLRIARRQAAPPDDVS